MNVGGDLYVMGVSENGDPWKIGIRDPEDPDGIIETLEVTDRAVVECYRRNSVVTGFLSRDVEVNGQLQDSRRI